MPAFESPELLDLFQTYTASPASIAAHFVETAARADRDNPLIVATGTDFALYPGGGAAPSVEGFRLSTRGFKELAGVSHLGVALATLARMKELDESGSWHGDAERLLETTKAVRAVNSPELWRDRIGVKAFAGRETAIAAMVDFSCRYTELILERALDDPSYLTPATLRREYLEGPAPGLAVPFNRIMTATFFLTGMDIAHRIIAWFDGLDLQWERAMVMIAGRQGRPSSGVTRESNSVAGVVSAASRGRLPDHRLYIVPHAPVFPTFDGTNLDSVVVLEDEYRRLWSSLRATSELGAQMFEGFPRFVPLPPADLSLTDGVMSVHEKPGVRAPDDWLALTTRLRVVMEDPTQLLSGAVTDYASRQLVEHDNDPTAVTVPGLDREPYPRLS